MRGVFGLRFEFGFGVWESKEHSGRSRSRAHLPQRKRTTRLQLGLLAHSLGRRRRVEGPMIG